MFRVVIVSALICSVIALPAVTDSSNTIKNAKKGRFYKFDGIIGGSDAATTTTTHGGSLNSAATVQYSENLHVRNSPQDPFESAEPVPNDLYRPKIGHQGQSEGTPLRIDYDDVQQHQAESAHYSFDSSIQDNINDQTHVRKEVRDGLKVTGMYGYSDGYFHRTIHYVADENGYRVVKEEVKKIGEGPQFNSGGRADVQGSLIGGYSIQIDDREKNPHYVGINQKP